MIKSGDIVKLTREYENWFGVRSGTREPEVKYQMGTLFRVHAPGKAANYAESITLEPLKDPNLFIPLGPTYESLSYYVKKL